MPKPRKELISLEATPYYHCVSRCVRRAFLCGRDSEGRSFEHRRGWIEHLLIEQAKVFCIDIAAYAVMSNHFHIVLHVNQSKARELTDLEIVQRWHQLYKGSIITQKFERGEELSEAQVAMLEDIIKLWRDRLISISWYMRRLNRNLRTVILIIMPDFTVRSIPVRYYQETSIRRHHAQAKEGTDLARSDALLPLRLSLRTSSFFMRARFRRQKF